MYLKKWGGTLHDAITALLTPVRSYAESQEVRVPGLGKAWPRAVVHAGVVEVGLLQKAVQREWSATK